MSDNENDIRREFRDIQIELKAQGVLKKILESATARARKIQAMAPRHRKSE